jgi:hypothetical protein
MTPAQTVRFSFNLFIFKRLSVAVDFNPPSYAVTNEQLANLRKIRAVIAFDIIALVFFAIAAVTSLANKPVSTIRLSIAAFVSSLLAVAIYGSYYSTVKKDLFNDDDSIVSTFTIKGYALIITAFCLRYNKRFCFLV